jgi:2-polyprenyl-6-hydroxyphenyl methylase/3-demethylubiquinone-9 3-methyltransferase
MSRELSNADDEIARGERFGFGANWRAFLDTVDDEKIRDAETSLREMLGVDLHGKRFLDAGCGSGLFSLAARGLGAEVVAFDFDAASVAASEELRARCRPGDEHWRIAQGSVLDDRLLDELGTFDVVYSWGVLHHTGDMWRALHNVVECVAPGGQLYIAIYNDQGMASKAWSRVKRAYNRAGRARRRALLEGAGTYFWARRLAARMLKRGDRPPTPRLAAMSRRHDLVDWVGGWPFEVAKPEEIFDFCRARGLRLERLYTCAGGHGCNEFVFSRAQ